MDYLLKCDRLYYGLAHRNVTRLAYQFALHLKIPVSDWEKIEIAGKEWFCGFMKRHPNLAIRKQEATSVQRATTFNRTNAAMFFNNLKIVYARHNFKAANVWNMDETGVTTVQTPDRVLSRKGAKQVGRITSSERGTLVIMALAVNAMGNTVPPFFTCEIPTALPGWWAGRIVLSLF